MLVVYFSTAQYCDTIKTHGSESRGQEKPPTRRYRESFTRNKSVKKRVTKTNLSTTLNTFLSITPYHFSVPLLSNQNLALSLQAVQRYAFPKCAFQKIFYRVLRIVYFFLAARGRTFWRL